MDDTLYEQYEEALTALIMREIFDTMGEEVLQEARQLQDDPSAAVPSEVTEQCLHIIQVHGRNVHSKKSRRRCVRIFTRVAAALLSVILLYAGAFASSETVRVHTLNFLVQDLGISTQFLFSNEVDTASKLRSSQILSVVQETVPPDFTYVSSEENALLSIYYFENIIGNQISVQYINLKDASVNFTVDTENAQVSHPEIAGQNVMLVYKDYTEMMGQQEKVYQIVWVCEPEQFLIHIRGVNVPLEDIFPVAEALIGS